MSELSIPELQQKIAQLQITRAVHDALTEVAPQIEQHARDLARAGISPDGTPYPPSRHPRSWGAGGPLNDTGDMIDGIHVEIVAADELEMSSDAKQAPIQQFGGTISPVKAKFLAIPLTEEAARSGGPRNYSGDLIPIINKAETGGVLIPADGGEAVFALTVGPVEIPARPFIGFSDSAVDEIMEMIGDKVADLIAEALQ